MNIFYLDQNPSLAAKYHCDRHVVKMVLESAQLLCSAHHMLDGADVDPNLYKLSHKNHPSAKWCRESLEHYEWLYWLFRYLCNEFSFRYGKIHLSERKLLAILTFPPKNIKRAGFVQPPQAMPEQYTHSDSIIAYRNYYIGEKHSFAKWTKRDIPYWWTNNLQTLNTEVQQNDIMI